MPCRSSLSVGIACVISIASLACCPATASAGGSLAGNVSLSAYSYGDTLEETQSELFTGLTVRLRDNSGLSCNLSARLREPLSSDLEGDWNLYSTYLGWASRGRRFAVTAGRRLIFLGVNRGFQDGLALELQRIHRGSGLGLTILAVQAAARGLDAELADDDAHACLGLVADARPLPPLKLRVSSRIDLEDDGQEDGHPNLIGLLIDWHPRQFLYLDGNIDYDLTSDRSERAFVSTVVTFSGLSCHAEYFRMESPWVPESSWYSRFRELLEPRTQYRLGLSGAIPSIDWLSGGFYWVTDDQDEYSVSGHFTAWGMLTLGYRFSGDDDLGQGGVYGSLRHRLSPALRVDAGVDLSRQTVYDLYDLPSYGSHLRVRYDAGDALHFFSEVQHRRDRVMDNDVRLYVGAGYHFRHLYGGTGIRGD